MTPDLLRQVSERHGLAGTSPVFPNHRKISLGRIHVGRLAGGESPTAAVERLEKDPSVEWAEPAYYRYVQETEPDDPGYDDQWHHFYIRSPAAWDLTTGSGDVAIAVIDTGQGEQQIGVVRYTTLPDEETCEFAIVVGDDWQGKGLARRMFTRLIEAARERRLKVMTGVTLRENTRMIELSRSLGFDTRTDPEDPELVQMTLQL